MATKTGTFCSGPYMLCGNSHKVGKVDTKTLVVGQDVYMFSGCYGNKGKVVKVTPSGADVQTGVMQDNGTWNAHELLHFDNNGRSYVTELPSSYDSAAHPLSPWGWNGNGTYECGPWELDDVPFADRTALLEQKAREWKAVSEQKDRDFKALFERAAQTAQAGGSTRITGLLDFLNVEEFHLADRMWKESKHDYANRIAKQIIEPNIARMNAALGLENSPKYLAYVVEYIKEYSAKKCS
jgi:hypothetical protein